MLFKLNSYIEMLHAMEDIDVPWKWYSDIPAEFIYNMDEIGNDMTKHRSKVYTRKQMQPALKRLTQQELSCKCLRVMDACCDISLSALQPKQMAHSPVMYWLIIAILFYGCALFDCWIGRGQVRSIFQIQLNKNKRERSTRESETTISKTPNDAVTLLRWTVRMKKVPNIQVETRKSGSMTKKVFFVYTKHFGETPPSGQGPVILFLDGHGSCWNQDALQYFRNDCVFPFILASHTSIWLQPNDAGVHWSIEEACRRSTLHD